VLGGTRKLTDFLALVPVTWVDEAALASLPGGVRSFRNVNTPEDLGG